MILHIKFLIRISLNVIIFKNNNPKLTILFQIQGKSKAIIMVFPLLKSINLENIIAKIFLLLTPASLHISRQVSKEWNKFIMHKIWNMPGRRKVLEKKLNIWWNPKNPKYKRTLNKLEFGQDFCDVVVVSNNHIILRRTGTLGHTLYDVETKEYWDMDSDNGESGSRKSWVTQRMGDHHIFIYYMDNLIRFGLKIISIHTKTQIYDEKNILIREIIIHKNLFFIFKINTIDLWESNELGITKLQSIPVSLNNQNPQLHAHHRITYPFLLYYQQRDVYSKELVKTKLILWKVTPEKSIKDFINHRDFGKFASIDFSQDFSPSEEIDGEIIEKDSYLKLHDIAYGKSHFFVMISKIFKEVWTPNGMNIGDSYILAINHDGETIRKVDVQDIYPDFPKSFVYVGLLEIKRNNIYVSTSFIGVNDAGVGSMIDLREIIGIGPYRNNQSNQICSFNPKHKFIFNYPFFKSSLIFGDTYMLIVSSNDVYGSLALKYDKLNFWTDDGSYQETFSSLITSAP